MATLEDQGTGDPPESGPAVASLPLLRDGQRLDQPTFHELYCRMPEDFRAELIDGVVHVMNMPLHADHGRPDASLVGLLFTYSIETPGTILQTNTTTKLGPRSEVQPDCTLLIDPAFGGRTGEDAKGYTTSGPELVIEVAVSSLRLDLNDKKKVYEEAGALEYLVYDVPNRKFHWFVLVDGKYEPLEPDTEGVYRSRAFPGFWFDGTAFVAGDVLAVVERLRLGLASPEHAGFVERLRQNRRDRP